MALPGGPARVVEERVGLVDLAPTLLELAGQAPPADADGRSLVPALRGEPLPTRAYFAEVRARAEGDAARAQSQRQVVVWHGPHKLWSMPRGERLYDLAADPSESAPLGATAAPELPHLARQHASGGAPETDATTDAETLEELRALGYVE
jgi:arylsulfatase A-like enzyme